MFCVIHCILRYFYAVKSNMGTMKMKNFFCLLSLYGFLSMNTIAAVFNILVVNTEIVLSVNDRPFIKPQGAGQEPRSIPMDVPFSAFLMMTIPLTWSSINL